MAETVVKRKRKFKTPPKVRGTRFENRVKKHLEKKGYLVTGAAGSFGVFDLVAISPATEIRAKLLMLGYSQEQVDEIMNVLRDCALGIQCKINGRLCKVERAEMIELAERYNLKPVLYWREGRKLRHAEVDTV